MTDQERRLSRDELLELMDTNWGRFLPTVNVLTDEERQAYTQAHGFANLTELIAYLCTQFTRVLTDLPALVPGVPRPTDPTGSTAIGGATTGDFSDQTLAQVEEDFERLHTGVSGMFGDIDIGAFDDAEVYNLLYQIAVEQYDRFEPPGDPQTPSAQHARVRPEPGDHSPPDTESGSVGNA